MPGTAEGPQSEPLFSLKGQKNDARLGEPIEVPYGKNRLYPSFAARPFVQYVNNEQYLYALYCLGQGEYEIHQILLGDTDITTYQDVQYQVIPPGGQISIFSENVYVSPDVGGITLTAPQDPGYNWAGPFPVCPPGDRVNKIELDFVWPNGLYWIKKGKKIKSERANWKVAYRPIDDNGNPTGNWTELPYQLYGTNRPIRKTYTINVPEGRYEVRCIKTFPPYPSTNTSSFSTTVWDGLRGYVTTKPTAPYGNVTLLALKIRASSNLNEQNQGKLSVIATRKLPIRNPNGTWSAPVATRSIVWAFVDVFRAAYGARVPDNFFDWNTLYALNNYFESNNLYFDWVFRDAISVWEAATTIARVGRAVPMLSGSLITMRRDAPATLPVTMFTPENIVKGSFQWDVKLWQVDEYDSVAVEYTEPDAMYQPEVVVCSIDGSADRPEPVRMIGVANRTHAYRSGLYMDAVRKHQRENISFVTGMEGLIPSYGDLIYISHDIPQWSQSGYVVDAAEISPGTYRLTLSEPVTWTSGNPHSIMFRGKRGEVLGPYTASPTSDPRVITINPGTTIDFPLSGQSEPMIYLFGESGNQKLLARVVGIEPQGNEQVRIVAVPYKDIIYSFDTLNPPPRTQYGVPPSVPEVPTVQGLQIVQPETDQLLLQISWRSSGGARYYFVEVSRDGTNWERVAQTEYPFYTYQPDFPGMVYVRVAGVGTGGQGAWATTSFNISMIAGLEVSQPWNALSWSVKWLEILNGFYQIKVYDASGATPVLKRTVYTDQEEFTYNYTMAQADGNVVRTHKFEIDVAFPDSAGGYETLEAPKSLTLTNAIPSAPTNITNTHQLSGTTPVHSLSWTNPSEGDLIKVKIWLSTTQGFDPNTTAPAQVLTGSTPGSVANQAQVPVIINGNISPDQYVRIGLFDVWGEEISTNISSEIDVSLPWILQQGSWQDTLAKWKDNANWRDS
jgi:hypothetical protein